MLVPYIGISPYDLTGYVPAAKTGPGNRTAASKSNNPQCASASASASASAAERPFPPRDPMPTGASRDDGPSPVNTRRTRSKNTTPNASSNDFGHKSSDFKVFGDLE